LIACCNLGKKGSSKPPLVNTGPSANFIVVSLLYCFD
jgi:hypothetical protein